MNKRKKILKEEVIQFDMTDCIKNTPRTNEFSRSKVQDQHTNISLIYLPTMNINKEPKIKTQYQKKEKTLRYTLNKTCTDSVYWKLQMLIKQSTRPK